MNFTAAVTTINEQHPNGKHYDRITIWDADGEFFHLMEVESSESEEPYVAALDECGFRITGTTPSRQDVLGNDAWTLAKVVSA